jgi:hypothetical protein
LNIANLLEEQKRLKEAYTYATIAARTYKTVYNKENANSIKILWQQLTIAYALKHEETENQANYMLQVMAYRD